MNFHKEFGTQPQTLAASQFKVAFASLPCTS